MKKVTMETAAKLQERNNAGKYYPVAYEGREYVQIADMDTMSGTFEKPYWEASAIRIGDEVDEDGFVPIYNLIWDVDNPDAEDGQDTVSDWDNVADVTEAGGVSIEDGRIV